MRSYELAAAGEPLVMREHPDLRPSGSEVLLRVLAAGICHTDLHLCDGYFDLGGGKRINMTERGITLPHTLGHENVGEVVALGPDAVGVVPGERRLIHPWIGCGECRACRRGTEQFCASPRFLGVFRPGGFSDFITVSHPRYLHDIGDLSPAEVAPLACSGLTTYGALNKIDPAIRESEPIVVIGAGGLGLMCLALLRLLNGLGAIVFDTDPLKREAAEKAGALATFDPRAPETRDEIERRFGAVAAAIDFVGTPETVQVGLDSLAKSGKLVLVGMFGGEFPLSLPSLVLRGLAIEASYVGSPAEMAELMQLVRQKGCPRIPVHQRSMSAANAALDDLRGGRVIGRTVLVPDPA